MTSGKPGILITGGSRGIGAAVAQLAARHGYDVALVYKSDEEAADRTAAACREAGARAYAFQGDMALERDIVRVFDDAVERPRFFCQRVAACDLDRAGLKIPHADAETDGNAF